MVSLNVLSVVSIPRARGMAGTPLREISPMTASPQTRHPGAFLLFLSVAQATLGGPLNRLYYGLLSFHLPGGLYFLGFVAETPSIFSYSRPKDSSLLERQTATIMTTIAATAMPTVTGVSPRGTI